MLSPSPVQAVTVVSPKYAHLAADALDRFRAASGLDVLVSYGNTDPAFAAKLNLDLMFAPGPVVFFDVDYWLLRPFDFSPFGRDGKFSAVPDPGVNGKQTFCTRDCAREGWAPETYFNSGLFVCDLGQPEIRRVFADARKRLADCHAGAVEKPADWTDQYFLNWAVQQQPGLFQPLPGELNFYMVSVENGYQASIPGKIIGLHAAGVPLNRKLHALRAQASVFEPQKPASYYDPR